MKREIRIEGDVAYVPLTKGYEAVVDTADVPRVQNFHWHAQVDQRRDGSVRVVYAARKIRRPDGQYRSALMHRELLGITGRTEGDHVDGDGLNNRRSNLRAATHAENLSNQRTHYDSASGCKGLTWHPQCGKWQVRIMAHGKRHYVGLFVSVEEARNAYAKASAELHGDFGRIA